MTTKDINAALHDFQRDLPRVGKTAVNSHFKSTYADLSSVVSAVLPILNAHGIAWVEQPRITDGTFTLHCELNHVESGTSIDGDWPLPDPAKTDPQKLGSALTYGRRYMLLTLTGIAPDDDDDDGAAASQPAARPKRETPPKAEILPDDVWTAWAEAIDGAADIQTLRAIYSDAAAANLVNIQTPVGRTVGDVIAARSEQVA